MNWSDWVSLLACVAAVLALVPAFAPMLKRRKAGKRAKESIQPEESAAAPEPVELNAFGKALVLTTYALAIGIIELVLFSPIAGIFGARVDVNTMPTNWLVAFYG